jgi:DNA-binding winged helix-turn-helix (wHTH) protein
VPIGAHFTFESFELDPDRRRLSCAGEPVALSERQLDVLLMLVLRAGQIVSKEDLLEAGWKDVAVGDNSLEQVISSLRRLLGVHANRAAYIETVPRRGYRFSAVVARTAPRETDAALDALLAPHRAFIEGRAALETLDGRNVARAREVCSGQPAIESMRSQPAGEPSRSSRTIGATTSACRTPAGGRIVFARHTARSRCCPIFLKRTGLPPPSMSPGRRSMKPSASCWLGLRRRSPAAWEATRASAQWRCTGCWG